MNQGILHNPFLAPGRIFPYPKPDGCAFHFRNRKKLKDLATQSGRATADELVRDVVEGYILELSQTRENAQQPL